MFLVAEYYRLYDVTKMMYEAGVEMHNVYFGGREEVLALWAVVLEARSLART